jgi:hypothetical protein
MYYQVNDRVVYNACESIGSITKVTEHWVTVQYDDFSTGYTYRPEDKFLSKINPLPTDNHYKIGQKIFWIHEGTTLFTGVVRYMDSDYIRVRWDDTPQLLTRHNKSESRLVKMCRIEHE